MSDEIYDPTVEEVKEEKVTLAPWRLEQTEKLPAASKVSPHRRVVIGVLAFLAAGILTYTSLLWLRPLPRPVLFSWDPGGYPQLPFGSVPFAAQDQLALSEGVWFTTKPLELPLLAEVEPQETVVLNLKGRAFCDAAGRVYLLGDDAEPGLAKSSVPLREVLKSLANCQARHKLVIIDLFWPQTDPYLADLTHDLPARVVKELEATPDSKRLAILSCQAGQIPLASADLGRSVFGHYIDEGLRGWADFDDAAADDRGRVTAKNLAEFVRVRVDRWAQSNRQTRQTPILIGDADDFPLTSLSQGEPQDHRELPKAAAYPSWLSAGWKIRATWHEEKRPAVAAWLARQLDTILLEAERDWAGGGNDAKVQAKLRVEIDRLEKTYAPLAAAPSPEPQSLAAAGVVPDEKLVQSLRDVVKNIDDIQRKAAKAEDADKEVAKLVDGFAPGLKAQSDVALAAGIFTALVRDPFPRRGTVLLFNKFLNDREAEPRYEETLIIHRLAALAAALREDQWPVRNVRKILELTRRATTANARPRPSAWLRAEVEFAGQKRHDADFLFFARGFVSQSESEKSLEDALTAYELLLNRQDTIENALNALTHALLELPWHARYQAAAGGDEQTWLRTVQAADDLAALLMPDDGSRNAPKLEEIGVRGQELQSLLAALRRPFATEAIAAVVAKAKGPDGDAASLSALELFLHVPWIPAEQRAEIWTAAREVGGKLAKKTADLEVDEKQQRPTSSAIAGEAERTALADAERVAGRVRRQLALMQLATVTANQIELLRRHADETLPTDVTAAIPPGVYAVADAIKQTWTQYLPTQWSNEAKSGRRERLAWLWPGWLRPPGQTGGLTQATAAPARQAQVTQWNWLADQYRFESRDPDAPPFFGRAAFAFRAFMPAPGPHVILPTKSTVIEINSAKSTQKIDVPLRFVGGPFVGAVDVTTLTADDEWLRVGVEPDRIDPPDPKKAESNVVPLAVSASLLPGAELSIAPRPLGFLVRAKNGERSSFHKVVLPYLPNPERVELILSTNPREPASPVGDLRLRPSAGKQPFYLFVRNGAEKARNIVVELRQGGQLVPGGAAAIAVAPRQTGRVPFPGLSPDKLPKRDPTDPPLASSLPVLEGNLGLKAIDKDTGEILVDREVKVTQASPREYILVPEIRFDPPAPDRPKNKLSVTVKAGAGLTGPPTVVELVLPKNRIPGLKAVRDGVFRGELRAPGEEIKLYASDLDFEPGTDEDGVATLTIDGIPRAVIFRVTYARFGEPTTPREDDRPALRIAADRYFRTGTRWEGTLEVDNPPTGAMLEVALGKYAGGEFDAEVRHQPLPARNKGIGFAVRAADGALEFEPFTRDWTVTFDSVPVRGERLVHARLVLDKNKDVVPPVDQVAIFDDSQPERVAFIDLPKRAQIGQPLLLQATALDKVAGIKEVVFYVGSIGEDKKLPAIKVVGELAPNRDDIWIAKLPMPADKKGPIDIGVQFTNRVGLSGTAKGTVELVEFDPVKNAVGSIQGNVVEGTIGQSGLVVTLYDPKGNKIAEQKSGKDGAFAFTKVPPGKYVLVSEKPSAAMRRRARANISVEPAQNIRVKLELTL